HQTSLDCVPPNISTEGEIFFSVPHPPIIVAGLPDFMDESQLFFRSKREPAFDHLHSSFQSVDRSDQQVKMIGHHNELMQQVFVSLPVMKQDVNEKAGHSIGLQYIPLLKCRGCDEIATVSG